ncbi:peptidase A2A [Phenylobacterium hankyongense]|uniref:Peptidase A2A n=1 Tax=Phenylobacterium hankyongense TaxID=1813876 RepID=A0A328B8D1_9CAUL|nr:retroviral-like aspartic protease family protein [Phenylobacterium hankyongense]RAK61238.1 peptidase A2A [Phenylobacterium hankyongense]
MSVSRREASVALLAAAGVGFLPGGLARAQVAPAEPPPPDDDPPIQLDTASDRFEHMLAPVTINDRGPFNFLLDTGANISCISRSLADRLGLEAGPPARVHTMAGVRTRPSVIIPRLLVGGRSRRTVRAPSLPMKGPEVEGVLGVDWLKGQRLVLGFKDKSLEITRSRSETSQDGRIVVPARRRMGQLTIVDADLSGKRISALIDSGSQVTICNTPLRKALAETDRRQGRASVPVRVGLETIAGEAFTGEQFYLPFLRLGGLHLGNVPVVHADSHVFDLWGLQDTPAIVLGMDLLTQFTTVALDFGRSQVRFDIA